MQALNHINPYSRVLNDCHTIVTTPLLLLELLLSSGMPLGDIVFTIFMDVRYSSRSLLLLELC